jgi:hypothetical protein
MKVRNTLGSLEVTAICNGSPSINTCNLRELIKANEPWNIGDKIEIVAVKEVERTLIVPEGVVIVQNGTYSFICIIIKGSGRAIGKFDMNGCWETWSCFGGFSGQASTEEKAKQALYEALANAKRDGFGWNTEEPDLSRYEKFSVWPIGFFIEDHLKYQTAINRGNAIFNHRGVKMVFIHGWTADGQVDLLKKLTKGELENG